MQAAVGAPGADNPGQRSRIEDLEQTFPTYPKLLHIFSRFALINWSNVTLFVCLCVCVCVCMCVHVCVPGCVQYLQSENARCSSSSIGPPT